MKEGEEDSRGKQQQEEHKTRTEKKVKEGEEDSRGKQQQEEHKTRTTLVTSGPRTPCGDMAHFLVQSVSVSSPKGVFVCCALFVPVLSLFRVHFVADGSEKLLRVLSTCSVFLRG